MALAIHETSCEEYLLRAPKGIPLKFFEDVPEARKLDDHQLVLTDCMCHALLGTIILVLV